MKAAFFIVRLVRSNITSVVMLTAALAFAENPERLKHAPFKFDPSKIGTNYRKGERLATSPDKKVRVEISANGKTAQLIDVASGMPFGKGLEAGDWTLTCCLFSPDGKYVITGSRMDDTSIPHEAMHIGEFQVWDSATGRRLWDERDGGPIKWMAFKSDGKTIEFEAEPYVSSGK
jgi:WD40 repeat protein